MRVWNSENQQISCSLILMIGLLLTTGSRQSSAQQSPQRASTVDISEGPIPGHAVGTMKLMDQPCFYGDHFHYELNSEGELRVRGPIVCGKFKAGGGELVCHLNPQLSCQARKEFSASPGAAYAITEQGVRVGGHLYAWTSPDQVPALLDSIRKSARNR
jgi:hypothetical protein